MEGSTPFFASTARPQENEAFKRSNAFGALRCLLALAVLYSHTFLLGGYGIEPFWSWCKQQTILGDLSVLGFFGLSGYLIAASFQRSRNVGDYLLKRARRILPGLWVCLFVTAFVLGPCLFFLRHGTTAGFAWWEGDQSALRFVYANAGIHIVQWNLAGILDGAPYNGSFNGSLWSLWPEVLCYLMTAVLGAAGLLRQNRALVYVICGCLAVIHFAIVLDPRLTYPVVPSWSVLADRTRYFLAFLVGTTLCLCNDDIRPGWAPSLVMCGVLVALAKFGGLQLLAPIILPITLILVGRSVQLHLEADISYGLYIYGFPVQQLLAATTLRTHHWLVFFAASAVISGVLAALSWYGVERYWLKHGKRNASGTA